jgi:hypothetical protein
MAVFSHFIVCCVVKGSVTYTREYMQLAVVVVIRV